MTTAFAAALKPPPVRADETAAAVYTRFDSDHTTVISPRVRANKVFGQNTTAEVTYAADVWTSASIDIRASASVRPVTEQRDELDFGLSHDAEDLRVRAGYRLSIEPDYVSHGVSLGGGLDLAQKAASIDINLQDFIDKVGRSGNPDFSRGVNTFNGRVAFTQVLDPETFVQLTYELGHVSGYQASPYRLVAIGGDEFGCRGVTLCIPEYVPAQRTRHAIVPLLRHAFTDRVSGGASYRFYIDDWSVTSHTVLADLSWLVSERAWLRLQYRFYVQDAAKFYQTRYTADALNDFRTRDRELSPFHYQRVGLEFEHSVPMNDAPGRMGVTLMASGSRFHYPRFVGLRNVWVLELSAALLFEM